MSNRHASSKSKRGYFSRRGSALLAVLWLSAALASIAFALAHTVRGEAERASTLADSTRAQYLASGGIQWALLQMVYGPRSGPNEPSTYPPRYTVDFPTGRAIIEVIPETARLSLNDGTVEDFYRLLLALGAEPDRARVIADAIVDWRKPGGGPLDSFYSQLTPSFRPRHASFEQVEEALLVRGMTPQLFHGSYGRDAQGRLARLGAFKDCVSAFGTTRQFDINTAEPALLVSVGVPPESIPQILEIRREHPFRNFGEVGRLGPLVGGALPHLRVNGNTIFTLRSTARLLQPDGSYSELRRSVSTQVKIFATDDTRTYDILRWNDFATSEVAQWQ